MKKANTNARLSICGICLYLSCALSAAHSPDSDREDFFASGNYKTGHYGGKLSISQRAEPKTLNPIYALDTSSREIIALITADLIHINRSTLKTEPAVASSWTSSADGREFVLHLRRGIRFSDGHPVSAADILFTFQVHLDERTHSPQRDLLVIAGKPIEVSEIDANTVRFRLPQRYAAAERLFDGIAILPRHLLVKSYDEGTLAQAWGLDTQASKIAGLGPFRLKAYSPGQSITVERNPYYWKKDVKGNTLPYLDELSCLYSADSDAEALRFQHHEIDVLGRVSAPTYSILEAKAKAEALRMLDLGPGLEYNFLFFNLNTLPAGIPNSPGEKQTWFRQLAFRRAISAAIKRDDISRLVYRGRAYPLSTHVTLGNKLWVNTSLQLPVASIVESQQLLRNVGFRWNADGVLLDEHGKPVSFSIICNASNIQHVQTATLIQSDLRKLGIDVRLAALEYHDFLNRVFTTFQYDAAVMSIASGDADPNSEMNVWTSGGSTHVWDLQPKSIQASWQREVDSLMRQQMVTLDYKKRKELYDRVQELIFENLPVICLICPNVLTGSTVRLQNFEPAILSSQTLWNVEEFFIEPR